MNKLYRCFLLTGWLIAGGPRTGIPVRAVQPEPYFPVSGDTAWETCKPSELDWDETAMSALKTFLKASRTKAFIILADGRIALEWYGKGHTANSVHEWNSAGKTLITTAVGVARHRGLLRLDDPVSVHLGNGWTNMPGDKERLITIRHLLSMTSGIDETRLLDVRRNLTYAADAGTRWAYGTVFRKLMDVVAAASGQPFDVFFDHAVARPIGLDGSWHHGLISTIYHSTARGMARFGLLALHLGSWAGIQVVDAAFFRESIAPSQPFNPSYGYLWWLNGQSTYLLPRNPHIHPGPLLPNAPTDLYAAMGANDQRLYVIPSRNLVVVRLGNATPDFDRQVWTHLNALIN